MRCNMRYLGLLLALPLALGGTPNRTEAQCFNCSGLDCMSSSRVGTTGPCSYTHLCNPFDPSDCWWDCSPGGGDLCFQQMAVAMSGQIVASTQPGSDGWSDVEQSLLFDQDAGVYRKRCNHAIVVLMLPNGPAEGREPIHRIVL